MVIGQTDQRKVVSCRAIVDLRLATSFFARLKGLLLTRGDGRSLMLTPCRSVHTFGMGYALDVAFIDREGTVLLSQRGMPPGSRRSCRSAAAVIEREHDPFLPWFEAGETMVLAVRTGSVSPLARGNEMSSANMKESL